MATTTSVDTGLQQVQTVQTAPTPPAEPAQPLGRKPRSSWAEPVVAEPLVQIETGDEPVAELAETKAPAPAPEEVVAAPAATIAPSPTPVATQAAAEPAAPAEPVFDPEELSAVLEKAGLELVQTRTDSTQTGITEAPVKLGRPRKTIVTPDADVELVQINTSKNEQ